MTYVVVVVVDVVAIKITHFACQTMDIEILRVHKFLRGKGRAKTQERRKCGKRRRRTGWRRWRRRWRRRRRRRWRRRRRRRDKAKTKEEYDDDTDDDYDNHEENEEYVKKNSFQKDLKVREKVGTVVVQVHELFLSSWEVGYLI